MKLKPIADRVASYFLRKVHPNMRTYDSMWDTIDLVAEGQLDTQQMDIVLDMVLLRLNDPQKYLPGVKTYEQRCAEQKPSFYNSEVFDQ